MTNRRGAAEPHEHEVPQGAAGDRAGVEPAAEDGGQVHDVPERRGGGAGGGREGAAEEGGEDCGEGREERCEGRGGGKEKTSSRLSVCCVFASGCLLLISCFSLKVKRFSLEWGATKERAYRVRDQEVCGRNREMTNKLVMNRSV